MFTRQHFVAIARIIFAEQDFIVRNRMAERFADAFAATNPRFNRGAFLAAAIDGKGV